MQKTEFKIIKLDNKLYHLTCLLETHIENNWGADADGNRGITAEIVDDMEVVEVFDGDLNEVTDETIINRLKELV